MSRRYHAPKPGEPTTLRGRRGRYGWKVMCCDCALVHVFLIEKAPRSRLVVRAWRDERATAAARRRRR